MNYSEYEMFLKDQHEDYFSEQPRRQLLEKYIVEDRKELIEEVHKPLSKKFSSLKTHISLLKSLPDFLDQRRDIYKDAESTLLSIGIIDKLSDVGSPEVKGFAKVLETFTPFYVLFLAEKALDGQLYFNISRVIERGPNFSLDSRLKWLENSRSRNMIFSTATSKDVAVRYAKREYDTQLRAEQEEKKVMSFIKNYPQYANSPEFGFFEVAYPTTKAWKALQEGILEYKLAKYDKIF